MPILSASRGESHKEKQQRARDFGTMARVHQTGLSRFNPNLPDLTNVKQTIRFRLTSTQINAITEAQGWKRAERWATQVGDYIWSGKLNRPTA